MRIQRTEPGITPHISEMKWCKAFQQRLYHRLQEVETCLMTGRTQVHGMHCLAASQRIEMPIISGLQMPDGMHDADITM
jgi:hypothetical protein